MTFTRVASSLLLGLTLLALSPVAIRAEATHGSEAGPHETEQVNTDPLEFQTDLAIWTAVVFLLLFLILWKFAWGPISEGLQRREQGISDQIDQAEQSNQEARELLAQYEQKLAASKDEVREILDQARRDAEQVGRDMLDKAKQESRAEQQRALQQIDTATAGALKELAEQGATLAVELAGKIVGAQIDAADHARLIERTMADFGRQASGTSGTNGTN